jgi:hypothetical protein
LTPRLAFVLFSTYLTELLSNDGGPLEKLNRGMVKSWMLLNSGISFPSFFCRASVGSLMFILWQTHVSTTFW